MKQTHLSPIEIGLGSTIITPEIAVTKDMLVVVDEKHDMLQVVTSLCEANWLVKRITSTIGVVHVIGDRNSGDLLKIPGVITAEANAEYYLC